MFICNECIKDYVLTVDLVFVPKSKGPCEVCHKISICYDLPHNSYYHKYSPYAQKLRLERGEAVTIDKAPPLFQYVTNQVKSCKDVYVLRTTLEELLKVVEVYHKNTFSVTVDKNRKIY